MPSLSWSRRAIQDLARLHAFLAGKDPLAARGAISAIRKGAQLLKEHPQVGPPMEGMAPEFRRLLIDFGGGGYVVLYRYSGGRALVLAVRHTREAGY